MSVKKALIALSFGTFGLGVAEFVMMAVLPYVAHDMGVSIPTAGGWVSAYALGVCCGAPLLVIGRTRPLKQLLLILVAMAVIGNLLATVSPSYWTLMGARFVSGLPHGAYFGVASLVALKLAPEGKGALAVSVMVAGMTVANLAGVPLSTFVSHVLSWRVAFLFAGLWGCVTLFFMWRWVPFMPGLPDTGFRGQFRFLRHGAPWCILAATVLGNGGVFCWWCYISPLLTRVSGFPEATVPLLMVLAGGGMVLGNALGGYFSDRFTPGRVDAVVQGTVCVALVGVFFFASVSWLSVALMFAATMGLFAISAPQQTLILKHAPGGELLGGACIQIAFNLGNAVGAQVGGWPLRQGLNYNSTALVGAVFLAVSTLVLLYFVRRYEPRHTACCAPVARC